ncbi:hypothetical protein CVB78_004442 [Escherichia coli]|nr:hypothetical protein [Escherichia coli]
MKHNNHKEKDPGVWLIWLIAALMVSLFLTITSAEASQTMHLVDEYIDDGVKVCVYATSDGRHYAEVERPRGSNCPYTHIEY